MVQTYISKLISYEVQAHLKIYKQKQLAHLTGIALAALIKNNAGNFPQKDLHTFWKNLSLGFYECPFHCHGTGTL